MKYRYIVVGGCPFLFSFTGISVVGHTDSLEEAKDVYEKKYDECGGFLTIIDCETGKDYVWPE